MHGLPRVCLALGALSLVACADPGPDTVARQFYSALAEYQGRPSSGLLRAAYGLLSADSHALMAERAEVANAGRPEPQHLAPWQLLSFGGLVAGDEVAGVEAVDVADESATVEVAFRWLVPSDQGGPATEPPSIRVSLVREDGDWKVALPLGKSR